MNPCGAALCLNLIGSYVCICPSEQVWNSEDSSCDGKNFPDTDINKSI